MTLQVYTLNLTRGRMSAMVVFGERCSGSGCRKRGQMSDHGRFHIARIVIVAIRVSTIVGVIPLLRILHQSSFYTCVWSNSGRMQGVSPKG